MVDDPYEIILEHLRSIRADITDLKNDTRALKQGKIAIRDEIHNLRGDFLRQERAISALETDMDRVNRRLDLSDEPADP